MGALITCTGAIVAWRADEAGAAAATYDRQGIVEAVRFQGEVERAETDVRTEERTFAAYAGAWREADARAASHDVVAAAEALAQRRLADRLVRGFPIDFVRHKPDQRLADGTFDTTSRVAELLREREIRDDSSRLFAIAADHNARRQTLLAVTLVLVLGLTATAFGHLSDDRKFTLTGIVGGCIALGYATDALVTAGF